MSRAFLALALAFFLGGAPALADEPFFTRLVVRYVWKQTNVPFEIEVIRPCGTRADVARWSASTHPYATESIGPEFATTLPWGRMVGVIAPIACSDTELDRYRHGFMPLLKVYEAGRGMSYALVYMMSNAYDAPASEVGYVSASVTRATPEEFRDWTRRISQGFEPKPWLPYPDGFNVFTGKMHDRARNCGAWFRAPVPDHVRDKLATLRDGRTDRFWHVRDKLRNLQGYYTDGAAKTRLWSAAPDEELQGGTRQRTRWLAGAPYEGLDLTTLGQRGPQPVETIQPSGTYEAVLPAERGPGPSSMDSYYFPDVFPQREDVREGETRDPFQIQVTASVDTRERGMMSCTAQNAIGIFAVSDLFRKYGLQRDTHGRQGFDGFRFLIDGIAIDVLNLSDAERNGKPRISHGVFFENTSHIWQYFAYGVGK